MRILLLIATFLTLLPSALGEEKNKMEGRYSLFNSFHIRGAGGTDFMELAGKYGANTIRTWTVTDETETWLNTAESLKQKMILGIWMPHQGTNKSKGEDYPYDYDYTKSSHKVLNNLQSNLDKYDSHPATLMWGLGNEVHLEEHYLRTVNEMAKRVHRHNPDRLTCIVIINAPEKSINLIKQYAPEVDMIGVNAYGFGAMKTAISNLETHWKKPYFFSEYSYKGPWSANKTASGHRLELTPAEKVEQLRAAYAGTSIGPNNTGGVVFVWDQHSVGMQTWFSLLLSSDVTKKELHPQGSFLVTPMADEMCRLWGGEKHSNLAPVVRSMTINDSNRGVSVVAKQLLKIAVTASDPDDQSLNYSYWVFEVKGENRQRVVVGPIEGASMTEIYAPEKEGEFRLFCLAKDNHGKASSHHLPFVVKQNAPNEK